MHPLTDKLLIIQYSRSDDFATGSLDRPVLPRRTAREGREVARDEPLHSRSACYRPPTPMRIPRASYTLPRASPPSRATLNPCQYPSDIPSPALPILLHANSTTTIAPQRTGSKPSKPPKKTATPIALEMLFRSDYARTDVEVTGDKQTQRPLSRSLAQ
ncbi:hypothetical protein C8T65DRAFT_783580 [Cerioporus squamosus]|nr:hypothetical protein C8T65DRAFT_783580 [Cerioporus squamosus]